MNTAVTQVFVSCVHETKIGPCRMVPQPITHIWKWASYVILGSIYLWEWCTIMSHLSEYHIYTIVMPLYYWTSYRLHNEYNSNYLDKCILSISNVWHTFDLIFSIIHIYIDSTIATIIYINLNTDTNTRLRYIESRRRSYIP